MTIAQTVVIISMGAMIVEPFADKSVIKTVMTAAIYVILLLAFEFLEFHFKGFSNLFVGKGITVIENGKVDEKNLKKLKLTMKELDSRLRQDGITKLSDIKKATLEYNGELGYELKKGASPLTVDDMEFILNHILTERLNKKPIDLVKELNRYTDPQ